MGGELQGLRIVSFESRHANDAARLIERRGGEALSAPSMRETPLEAHEEVLAFGERLIGAELDVLVLLTGVGTRMLVQVLSTRWPQDTIVDALALTQRVCRGPKPAAALKELGLRPTAVAPEPNTWHEVLDTIDRELPVQDKRVAVQEYGRRNEDLLQGLRDRGAHVEPVTIYRWQLPEDTGPLEHALRELADGRVDVALFTSANQVDNVLEVAQRMGRLDDVRAAFAERTRVASVGPTTSEALRGHGIPPAVEPERPKLGALVSAIGRSDRGG